ncbi:choice-of-anchor R domain-containing protein [Chloroflexota bacterium]
MRLYVKGLYRELFRVISLILLLTLVVTGAGSKAAKAVDPTWIQTSQADFEAGTLFQVDTSSSPGDVKLAIDPSGELLDQDNPNHNNHWYQVYDNKWCAQTFVADMTGDLTKVALYLKKKYSPGQLIIEIRNTVGVNYEPGDTVYASLTTSAVTSTHGYEYQFTFPSPASVTSGTHYAIVLQETDCSGSYYWAKKSWDIYPNGKIWLSYDSGGSWSVGGSGTYDFYFRTYVTAEYYSSGTLTSSTHDTGYAADFGTISWNATTPSGTTVQFQIATNSDNSTWNFKGPDGGSWTYYTSSGTGIWSGHNSGCYIKYKAFLSTADTSNTPGLHDISITYTQQAPPVTAPTVTTDNATLVEETTATLHGTVTDDGGEACQYRFQWGTVSGSYSDNTAWTGSKTTGESFDANITGLNEGTRYYFIAEAKNSVGTSSGSELSFLTKPDAPISFSATVISGTQIDLGWTKGDGANRTMVRRDTGSYPADKNDGVQVYFDTGTSVSDTGLSAGTTYYYRAWSEVTGSQQWSDNHAQASATTSGGPPPPPPPPPPVAVGGTVYPVDKVNVLLPWLFLFSLLSLAVVSGAYYLRKRGSVHGIAPGAGSSH